MANRFSSIVKKINRAPKALRSFLLSKLFSSQVKFAGTTGIRIEKLDQFESYLSLKNAKKVQNHIGGVHAVAAAVLAESATGIVFGMNVPDNKLPLLKTMTISYQRRMQGALQAKASLTAEQVAQIETDEKGSVTVPVVITDESKLEPIVCQMEWAWVSKNKS
ncbi:DUF4442 domain-containing protein [Litorilituus sediminis]|uniref:DUF4442 domain-containing protein n=1 Tax=Litorilituus sediminis TaxID=718192 RepID=A0A4P6P4F5_9GAMM|nr:DUF4442 domain-containing protein [Litorilituus sediminis]QBG36536.1 DUF4442 domain-containing protein [Litorilituus sediminis]